MIRDAAIFRAAIENMEGTRAELCADKPGDSIAARKIVRR